MEAAKMNQQTHPGKHTLILPFFLVFTQILG